MVSQQSLALVGLIGLMCILTMGYLLKSAEQFSETTVANGQVFVGSQAEADIVLRDLPLNGQVLVTNVNTKNVLEEPESELESAPDNNNKITAKAYSDQDEDEDEDEEEDDQTEKRTRRKRFKHPKYIDDGSPWLMYPSLNLLDLQHPKTTAAPNPTTRSPQMQTTTTTPTKNTSSPPPMTSFAPLANYAIRLGNPQHLNNTEVKTSNTVFRDQQQSTVMSPPTTTQPPQTTIPLPPQTTTPLPSSTPESLPETPPNYEGTDVFLDNGIMRVGFDLERGASLFYIASKAENDYKDVNLINDYDCGRMIQQSYYGREDGSVWPFPSGPRLWRWNPVQAGNYLNVPSITKAWTNKLNNNCFTSFTTPRHWVTGKVLDDVELKQEVCLEGDVVRMTFKMTYNGTVAHPRIEQELPAIYMWKGLSRLVLYDGEKPWTNDDLTTIDPPLSVDVIPAQSYAMENWAAYVSRDHGWGLGVLFPHTNKLSYYLVSSSANGSAGCSYLAPVVSLEITPGYQHEYDIFLVTGTIEEIRKKIYGLKNKYSMFE
jgi:hypothetical protein